MSDPFPDLGHLLGGLHKLADLHTLAGVTGHNPCYQELPAFEGVAPTAGQAALLGVRNGYQWLGVAVDRGAGAAAGIIARQLARRGRLALVTALDEPGRQLALSVSFGHCPVLTVDLDHPSSLALECLTRLAGIDTTQATSRAARTAEVLDIESVGRKFFLGFRSALHTVMAVLPARMGRADRHSVALLQLTRVLFLYFVQARGWLDGRPHFLRHEVDRCLGRGRSINRDLLTPLFFGTLNQPATRRGKAASGFGRIPFLNGGLFEPHPLERQWQTGLPDTVWCGVFDDLFERYHFTTGGRGANSIAPDMLGRVFEGVMDPEERSLTGTFYTPATTVHDLVRAGVVSWLAGALSCAEPEAERRLDAPDEATRGLLERITILDPAAGSGAFLIGALQLLARATRRDTLATRRRIMARNLFGVDLNPAAVRLTELRLWLALLEVDRSSDPERVRPLPNLDAIVRQGDSLHDPMSPAWGGTPGMAEGAVVRALRLQVQTTSGAAKRTAIRDLRRAEASALDGILAESERGTRVRMDDLLSQGKSLTLFGDRRGLEPGERRVMRALQDRRRFLLRLRRQLHRDGSLPWFHYQSQFAEVFARGGFDLVVGNPPWVRAEDLPAVVRQRLGARYAWWTTRPGSRGYSHLPDLSVAFVERARELVAPEGAMALLLPAKLATTDYAATMRGAMAVSDTLSVVADLTGDPRARFEATTYPMALVSRKARPAAGHQIRTTLNAAVPGEVSQSRLGDGPWILAPDRVWQALEAMRARHPVIGDTLPVHLGVKTGLNRAFIDPEGPIEPELLCWALRGRDVSAFGAAPTRRLLWTHDFAGRPLPQLPPLARAHLRPHLTDLARRKDYLSGPPWTVFRVVGATLPHRVVWADLSPKLQASVLNGALGDRIIPLNSCYLVGVPHPGAAHCLAAWLNATPIRAAAALTADPASGGYRRFNARVVSDLPLPEGVLDNPRLLALGQRGRAGTLNQQELDEACHEILGLDRTLASALAGVAGGGPSHRC